MGAAPSGLSNDPPAALTQRVLVCLSESPTAEAVLRAAAQIARALRAELLALHVEPPGAGTRRPPHVAETAARNLQLAADLGARVEVVVSYQVAASILTFARAHRADRIVVGRSRRGWIARTLGEDIVGRLQAEAAPRAVVVIEG